MKRINIDLTLAYLCLISGLAISAVAVYYSVVGLIAIFAAAAIPIIIMGSALEISKLVATMWLKYNWRTASWLMKSYLSFAVVILMVITSMGIFGFLSKAHLDQALPSGDITAKLSIIDEKIKVQKDIIESNRKVMTQMDEAVDQTMVRSNNEQGASRAAQLRQNQQRERQRLISENDRAQREIAKLQEQRAPIASEMRKVEAEVGPIKYLAAFFYGNTDQNILEKAVTWVIVILIVVFDPLAIVLLLASQISFQRIRQDGSVAGTEIPRDEIVVESIKVREEDDHINLWNRMVNAVNNKSTKKEPEPEIKIPKGYVQNEEQLESDRWARFGSTGTSTITEQEYFDTAEKKLLEYVEKVKNGELPLYKVPEEFKTKVLEKINENAT